MLVQLTLSNESNPEHTRVSEVGMTLKALLQAFNLFDNEIAQEPDLRRKTILQLEQVVTGEVFQKLMDTMDAVREGRNA